MPGPFDVQSHRQGRGVGEHPVSPIVKALVLFVVSVQGSLQNLYQTCLIRFLSVVFCLVFIKVFLDGGMLCKRPFQLYVSCRGSLLGLFLGVVPAAGLYAVDAIDKVL